MQPVGRSLSVKCPTLMPSTAVSVPFGVAIAVAVCAAPGVPAPNRRSARGATRSAFRRIMTVRPSYKIASKFD